MEFEPRPYKKYVTPVTNTEDNRASTKAALLIVVALTVFIGFVAFWSVDRQTDYFRGTQSKNLTEVLADSPNRIPIGGGTTETEILAAAGAPSNLKVVFSENPEVNCGYEKMNNEYAGAQKENWVAGCFNSEYPDTLFVYWGKNTDFIYRKFTLLHEYGHYTQYAEAPKSYFQLNEGDTDNPVELDADCRAVSFGAQPTDQLSCTIPDWTMDWLKQQS